jgi:hypothetical protein
MKDLISITMKNNTTLLCVLLLVGLSLACQKQKDITSDTLNVSGFKSGNYSELVNVKLKSGKVTSSPVECYLLGSTLFDPKSGGYGYVDCHGKFNLIDPLTGDTIRSIAVPEFLSQTVIDSSDYMLIGQRYEEESNYVYKINLETGEMVARNPVDFGPGINMCTYFYKAPEKEYVLMRADSTMIFINPDNGEIVKSVKAASSPENGIYNAADDLLIGLTYSAETDQNYLVTLNAETGELVHQVQIQERNDYYACMSSYDAESNCYILLNPSNVILFIDIETGDIKSSYEIGFQVQEFKFWRGREE